MADKDQGIGSLGITQRWKEFVTGFHARLFGAMLYTPDGDSMADDTANAVKAKLSANSGVDIGDVDVTSVIPGTGATNLGKAVDSVAGATDTGVTPLAIRDDALAALTPIEGDYVPLRTDANGALWTRDDILDAVIAGSELQVDVVGALPAGTNAIGKLAANSGVDIGDVDILSIAAGDNNIGNVDIASALPAGTNAIGKLAANSGVDIGDVDVNSLTLSGTAVVAAGSAGDDVAQTGSMWVLSRNHLYNVANGNLMRHYSVGNSGGALGAARVGTLGELLTLAASAARTSSANGTAVTGLGWRNRYIILFDVTALATDADDTLDLYVDVSLDGTTWLNAVHATQRLGNGAAAKEFAVLDPSAPGTATIAVTSDAAVSTVRPSMFGDQMRARWAIVDPTGANVSFTFSITAWAI